MIDCFYNVQIQNSVQYNVNFTNRYNRRKRKMKYKITWYHGFDGDSMKASYTCSKCQHEVKVQDLYCRSCGMNFITGETPNDKYKAGYEQAKQDIIRLLKGGK